MVRKWYTVIQSGVFLQLSPSPKLEQVFKSKFGHFQENKCLQNHQICGDCEKLIILDLIKKCSWGGIAILCMIETKLYQLPFF